MRTFNISHNNLSREETGAFFKNRSVKVNIMSLGAAFPLSLDDDIHPSQKLSNSSGTFPVRAFLFYIKSFGFETYRGETGEADLEGFSFQFVPRYFSQIRLSQVIDFNSFMKI